MASRRLLLLHRPQRATAAIATALAGYHAAYSSSHIDTGTEYSCMGRRYETGLTNNPSWMSTAACEQRRQRTADDGVQQMGIGLRYYLVGKARRAIGSEIPGPSNERDVEEENSSGAALPEGGSSEGGEIPGPSDERDVGEEISSEAALPEGVSSEGGDSPPYLPDLSQEENGLVQTKAALPEGGSSEEGDAPPQLPDISPGENRLVQTKGGMPEGGSSEEDDAPPHLPDLSQEENRLVRTFDRAAPSVAHVQTTAVVHAHPFSLRAMEVPAGTGSGFLWDNEGHVVTNYHVIAAHGEDVTRVLVRCQGMAEPVDAEVVGLEPENDIAVLKISGASTRTSSANGGKGGKKGDEGQPSLTLPQPLEVGTSSALRVGQTVLAIGNPFGLDFTLTNGIVSALGRDIQTVTGRLIRNCIQTDASINAGNSGGPLLDSRGRLIGVNVAIYSPGGSMGGNVGIGFAIPVDTVRRVVEQIIRHGGSVARPRLGVDVADDRVARSLGAQLGRRLEGALVVEVTPHGPAARSGIRATSLQHDGTLVLGDLIVEVDGRPVRQVEDLLRAVEERHDGADREDGEEVLLRIHRGCDPSLEETVTAYLDLGDGRGHWAARRGFGGGFQAV